MLKYGNILQVSNGNSKTLIPRNLTYNSSVGTTQTIIGSGSTSQSTANFNSATITDLTINTLWDRSFCNSDIPFTILIVLF